MDSGAAECQCLSHLLPCVPPGHWYRGLGLETHFTRCLLQVFNDTQSTLLYPVNTLRNFARMQVRHAQGLHCRQQGTAQHLVAAGRQEVWRRNVRAAGRSLSLS